MSNENFETLLNENLDQLNMQVGSIIKAQVLEISNTGYVTVSAGLKSEADIPVQEFKNSNGEIEIKVGDYVDVAIEAVENGFGETCLSREKAINNAVWKVLEDVHNSDSTISGIISERVKGGFVVELSGINAFLPGSLIDVRPVKDPACFENKALEFKIVKLDRKRNNIVVSRRAVLELENSEEREQLLENLQDGMETVGIVKNLTDYGAFVDLGGIDGLLHITDMSWKRLKHPSEIVNVGDEITVKVLSFDKAKQRVSLGLKQLQGDPWSNITAKYPNQKRIFGNVTNVTEYGCFVEIEDGIEGLVHMSEMDWTNKNIHPSNLVQVGDEVEVMILEIDEKRRRISLGLKQCSPNPWQQFESNHSVGEKIKGNIRSITDFGVFIGLENNIDGLIHQTDISWNQSGESAIRDLKKGEEVEAIILSIDSERERISLGLKQLTQDPFEDFFKQNPIGTNLDTSIIEIDQKKLIVTLENDLKGCIRLNEQTQGYKVGDSINCYVETKELKHAYLISLSIYKPKESSGEEVIIKTEEAPSNNIVAELLKAQLNDNKD